MMYIAVLIAMLVSVGAAVVARKRRLQRRIRPKSRYFSVSLAQPKAVDPVDKAPN
ncbi:hypothetical protein AB5I39_14850 [Sphingomonas sp. MMS24-J45]|uniref:hypothetical protein n=1 Tax=Sphingomonas sp. MMS24-J45 TaxID=3238806 RepID=UPI00384B56B5